MKIRLIMCLLLAMAGLTACTVPKQEMRMNEPQTDDQDRFYLPSAEASRVVSVTNAGPAAASILVQTHRAAVKETGPPETVKKFGEVYAFSPNFFAVHRDEPTQFRFWNLQPDDTHTFMLVDPQLNVVMNVRLPPVQETSYVLTFHQEGLFNFYCGMHQPGMRGQILVLPPK